MRSRVGMSRVVWGWGIWVWVGAVVLGGGVEAWGATTGTVIAVPGDYPTIGEAIVAADPGDEIVVSPGVYPPFGIDRRVTVRSTFDGTDWSVVENTVIKASSQGGSAYVGVQSISAVDGAKIRGFKMTRDPISLPPNVYMSAVGIISGGAEVDIEYCIIENCFAQEGPFHPPQSGSAIKGISGMIQFNIIRNNRADAGVIAGCSGTLRNNIMSYNVGGTVSNFLGDVINNTVYYDDTSFDSGVGVLSGLVLNNIIWNAAGEPSYGGPAPIHCIISGYMGPGENIITADPRFVDSAGGDFRLQFDSPAIDAGVTTETTPVVDLVGVARGVKGVDEVRGDGSGMDIGAYEFVPVKSGVGRRGWGGYW